MKSLNTYIIEKLKLSDFNRNIKYSKKESSDEYDLIDFCKAYIYDWLDEHIGFKTCGADLGLDITKMDNFSGSVFKNRIKAKKIWNEWKKDYIDAYLQYLDDLGYSPESNFTQEFETDDDGEAVDYEWVPKDYEKETTRMVIWMVEEIIGSCKTVKDNWNDDFEITKLVADNIKREVKKVK